MKKALRVVFEPDEDGWWAVSIPDVRGVRTDSRTLEEGRRKIREALASAEDIGWSERRAASVELVEEVRLPVEIEELVGERVRALHALEDAAEDVERATADLVKRLTSTGRSLRDIAALLGISHGRVHQILGARSSPETKKDRRSAANRAYVVGEAAARYRTTRRRR